MIPCMFALDDTSGAEKASEVFFFCDDGCRERFQPPADIARLQSGDHPLPDKPTWCGTCTARLDNHMTVKHLRDLLSSEPDDHVVRVVIEGDTAVFDITGADGYDASASVILTAKDIT